MGERRRIFRGSGVVNETRQKMAAMTESFTKVRYVANSRQANEMRSLRFQIADCRFRRKDGGATRRTNSLEIDTKSTIRRRTVAVMG